MHQGNRLILESSLAFPSQLPGLFTTILFHRVRLRSSRGCDTRTCHIHDQLHVVLPVDRSLLPKAPLPVWDAGLSPTLKASLTTIYPPHMIVSNYYPFSDSARSLKISAGVLWGFVCLVCHLLY